MDLSLVPYTESPAADKSGDGKYRECLRNHAASMGGQALDGCGEFMAGEGEFLKCAACGCHRNFHRREGSPARNHPLLPVSFFPPPPLPLQQIPQPLSPRREEAPIQKRNRTKFTAEQKEKMRIFAEKLGWRIQKHDDEALEEFCVEIGVNRHVLKVWMHNHKNNLSSSAVSAVSAVAGAAAAPSIRV